MKTLLTALIICIASGCTVPVKSLTDCNLTVSRSNTTAVMTCRDHEPIQLPNFDPAFSKCVTQTPEIPVPTPATVVVPATPATPVVPATPDAGSTES